MDLIDVLTGVLLMNAMPHFIFGITRTRFLGLFGFSSRGNIIYAVLQFLVCLVLFHLKYGIRNIPGNGIFIGCCSVLIMYFLVGRNVLRYYNRTKKESL